MNEKDFFEKSLTISTEFSKYVLAHPEIGEEIPDNAMIVFLLEDDPEFNEFSIEIARASKGENQPVIIVKADGIAEPLETRLINPHLEFSASL